MNKHFIFFNPWENRITDSLRLFMDLFHHKVLISALFCGGHIPLNLCHFFFDDIQVFVIHGYAVPCQLHDFSVFQNINLTCMFQHRRNIRRNIIAVFRKSDDQRTVFFYRNNLIRIIFIQNTEGIGSFNSMHHP